jgi:hypothetical protein
MHNWYVEEVANRRMRYEREQAAQARTLRKLADKRASWGCAWLATWLRRLSVRRTPGGGLTSRAG